jgi:hypothetical protein
MRRTGIALVTLSLALAIVPITPAGAVTDPDARRILFVRGGDIYSVQRNGFGERRLTFTRNNDDPSWSPSGTRIAFTSSRDGDSEIFTMNPDGSGVLKLTRNTIPDVGPVWSPKGFRIAFLRFHTFPPTGPFGETTGLTPWLMRSDGSAQRSVGLRRDDGAPFPDMFDLEWSPDGALLAGSGSENAEGGSLGYVFDLSGEVLAGPFGSLNASLDGPSLGWANDGDLLGCVDGWLTKWSVFEPPTEGERLVWVPQVNIFTLPCDNPSMSGGGRFVVFNGDGVLWGIGYPFGIDKVALALADQGAVYDWSPSGRLLVLPTTDGLRIVAPDYSFRRLLPVSGSEPNW